MPYRHQTVRTDLSKPASTERHERLQLASRPRRATPADASKIARMFAAAFVSDPVFDWIARPGPGRLAALEGFFRWLLETRAIPFNEVWMADDASVAAAWLPPGAPASPGGLIEQLKLFPLFVRLCGFSRLTRGSAMADAMEKNHPRTPHYYLAFIAAEPRHQGMGLGSALLESTLHRIDEAGLPSYLENSNPKNTRLYERAGFAVQKDIAPKGAPSLLAMWRSKRT